jgi:hypothetical protein
MDIVEVVPIVWKTTKPDGPASFACQTCRSREATVRLTIQEAGGAIIRIFTCRSCIEPIWTGTVNLTRRPAPGKLPKQRRRLIPCHG